MENWEGGCGAIGRWLTAPSLDGLPHSLAVAELGGQRLDLAASSFERAGAIDFLGGQAKFFLDGKLRGDAAAGFRFAKPSRQQPLELLLGTAPRDHHAIKIFVNGRFD